MVFFTDAELDRLLEDDVPSGDMTTELMNIGHMQAELEITARQKMVICGTEEVVRIYKKVGIQVLKAVPSGVTCEEGELILKVKGMADVIHTVWRTGGVWLSYASGIAGRTAMLCQLATSENPKISVAGTRKHPPFLKKIAIKAVVAGGGVPHRTGLSDSILIFKEHLIFRGGYEHLEDLVEEIHEKQKERKIVVEAHTREHVEKCVEAGVDVIQIDKMPVSEFTQCVDYVKAIDPNIMVLAAGGVNGDNAAAYARAGADVLVTSWMYYAVPADVNVKIIPL